MPNSKFIAMYARKIETINQKQPEGGFKKVEVQTPIGVVIAIRNDSGIVKFGWSSCDSKDTFSKSKALEIAKARALKGSIKPIPTSLSGTATEAFVLRCEKYFDEGNLGMQVFKPTSDGTKGLYSVYSDFSVRKEYNPHS